MKIKQLFQKLWRSFSQYFKILFKNPKKRRNGKIYLKFTLKSLFNFWKRFLVFLRYFLILSQYFSAIFKFSQVLSDIFQVFFQYFLKFFRYFLFFPVYSRVVKEFCQVFSPFLQRWGGFLGANMNKLSLASERAPVFLGRLDIFQFWRCLSTFFQ